jgi:hypothetical protein
MVVQPRLVELLAFGLSFHLVFGTDNRLRRLRRRLMSHSDVKALCDGP